MSAAFAAFKKQHDALFVVRAWLYAGQVSYGIAARMAQREGKRASDADPLEANCASPDTRPILAAHGLEEESAKVPTHAKQTRTHVAHPPIIPSEEEVRKLMKALALKEAEEAALLRVSEVAEHSAV